MDSYSHIYNNLILAILLVAFAYVCLQVWKCRDDVNHKLRLQGWSIQHTLWNGTVYQKGVFITKDKLAAIEYEAQLELNKLGMLKKEG